MLHNSDRKRKRSRYLEEKYLDMVHVESKRLEERKARGRSIREEYEANLQEIKRLQVTPLRLPSEVQQETCKELENAVRFKPDGWNVYLRMYTERLPLKGIRSKFEVFGLDEKGNRYPAYQSNYFEMPMSFSHPYLQNEWRSFKWYPSGVHAEGVSKNAPKDIEWRADFMYTHYYIFIPNTPENERP